VLQPLMR